MQQLRENAEGKSGVPYSAVEKARAAGLYERIGVDGFKRLSAEFYNRVYSDEAWFRAIFSNTTKAAAIRNQFEFLVQDLGGPHLYEARKGHTALLGRHAPYPVTHEAAARWLQHMHAALECVPEIDAEARLVLRDYFTHMASFVVFGKEMLNPLRTVGYFGKHKEGHV